MTAYLDTSLVVAALTDEPATGRVQDWLTATSRADTCVISEWVLTEFSSALSIKIRTGHMTVDERSRSIWRLDVMRRESLAMIAIHTQHFRMATTFVDRHDLGLRPGDAFHLAVCASQGSTLFTLDRRLAETAPAFGVAAHLV